MRSPGRPDPGRPGLKARVVCDIKRPLAVSRGPFCVLGSVRGTRTRKAYTHSAQSFAISITVSTASTISATLAHSKRLW